MRDKLIELIDDFVYNIDVTKWYSEEHDEGLADHLIANRVILLPCKEGDTIYRIVKFCEKNTGCKEFYRPTVEFEEDCPHLRPQSWYDDCDVCTAAEDYDDSCYCSLYLKVLNEACKGRFAIQKDKFTFGKMKQVYGTPMFDESTSPEHTYYLTMEDAEKAMEEIKNEN